jgi:hypothetical protein
MRDEMKMFVSPEEEEEDEATTVEKRERRRLMRVKREGGKVGLVCVAETYYLWLAFLRPPPGCLELILWSATLRVGQWTPASSAGRSHRR